jgi:hypothetical protein
MVGREDRLMTAATNSDPGHADTQAPDVALASDHLVGGDTETGLQRHGFDTGRNSEDIARVVIGHGPYHVSIGEQMDIGVFHRGHRGNRVPDSRRLFGQTAPDRCDVRRHPGQRRTRIGQPTIGRGVDGEAGMKLPRLIGVVEPVTVAGIEIAFRRGVLREQDAVALQLNLIIL